jgi:hypothetical protein
MKNVILCCTILVSVFLAGCGNPPSKQEFLAMEAECVRCYTQSNALAAEAALLECVRFAEQCQKAGVRGILFDEVFARLYGRLYVVARHLGHNTQAERYLEKYGRYHAALSTLTRRTGHPHGEMVNLIKEKYDHGLHPVWMQDPDAVVLGRSP